MVDVPELDTRFADPPFLSFLWFTRNRIAQWSIPFFPLNCRHSQHGKTCEAPKKEWSVDPFHVADEWEIWVLVGF